MADALFISDEVALSILHAAEARGEGGPRIARALEAELGREVTGVLLYGSRARGEETETSDVDALVFAETRERGGLRGTSAGVDLDVEVVPASFAAEAPASDWIHVVPGVPLFDPLGAVASFAARVEEHRARGPEPMSDAELHRYRVWARRMLARIDRHQGTDPALADYQAAWLLSSLLDLYFRARGLWTRSAKEALAYWTEHDPEHRSLWDEHARERGARAQLRILASITASALAER